ncbi:chromate transporter [Aquibacillus halophilus]|uniref:Chromate transporter n=2 Tax=Aquibacillus halophilus TaxID=930132 RepID=A0A6A8DC61_9BACI|nr:chromate transporter [Aquibacillus halophilus]
MIGFVSFGGGYAMIPVIEIEVSNHGWMTTQEFTDVIAIAGMSPGPIATNSAIFVGYKTAELPGAIVSALAMVIPSLLIILIIATFFFRFNENKFVKSAFYGLRPIITGLIVYAAIKFAITNNVIGELSWHTASLMIIFGLSLFSLIKLRLHPLFVIALSGFVGMVLY